MSDANDYPYETRLDVYYRPLEVIDEKALSDASGYKWYNPDPVQSERISRSPRRCRGRVPLAPSRRR